MLFFNLIFFVNLVWCLNNSFPHSGILINNTDESFQPELTYYKLDETWNSTAPAVFRVAYPDLFEEHFLETLSKRQMPINGIDYQNKLVSYVQKITPSLTVIGYIAGSVDDWASLYFTCKSASGVQYPYADCINAIGTEVVSVIGAITNPQDVERFGLYVVAAKSTVNKLYRAFLKKNSKGGTLGNGQDELRRAKRLTDCGSDSLYTKTKRPGGSAYYDDHQWRMTVENFCDAGWYDNLHEGSSGIFTPWIRLGKGERNAFTMYNPQNQNRLYNKGVIDITQQDSYDDSCPAELPGYETNSCNLQ